MTSQNKRSVIFSLILSSLIACCVMFSSTCFSLEIKVKDRVKIDGDTVYLGDIATFNPADDIRVDKLKAIDISVSPSPDTSRRINKDLILYKVAHLLNDGDIKLSAPDSMIVERTAQIVKGKTMEKIFNDYVMENAPWDRNQIHIEKINAPDSIALPKGKLSWEIAEKQNSHFLGNFALMIDFRVNDDSLRKIIVSGKIAVTRDIVKAARNINSGDIISAEDVVQVSQRSDYFRRNLISNTQEIIGKRATRRIQADQSIQKGMFEVPPAVEKGDRVIIKAENNIVLITASGKALEEGGIGDQIRVKNTSSGKEIVATIKKPDLVEVEF
jgi:flagella basal body P-ring formation protein FlgA